MSNVQNLKDWSPKPTPIGVEIPFGKRGGGGDNGGMDRFDHLEKRVEEIDDRLGRIETSLVALEGGLSSKMEALRADIHKSVSENNKWTHTATVGMFSAFILGVLGLLFTIWNAGKAPTAPLPTPQQGPVIITIPTTPAAPTSPALPQLPLAPSATKPDSE
ncbi:hypothetical protein [Achromobacter xylosoxidans]|uniref:hypothetical protein n=1 Tax=Alcaligenes xylosoxydans xylosoxydans TaxID=85698 RepID=UPI0012DD1DFC|nr:hypothetical protein [Achromobacter xylosoxidans]